MTMHPEFIYANGAEVSVSFYDFSIRLKREGSPQSVVDRVPYEQVKVNIPPETFQAWTVAMSPQHAKELGRMLLKGVESYESMFGVIPSAPEGVK